LASAPRRQPPRVVDHRHLPGVVGVGPKGRERPAGGQARSVERRRRRPRGPSSSLHAHLANLTLRSPPGGRPAAARRITGALRQAGSPVIVNSRGPSTNLPSCGVSAGSEPSTMGPATPYRSRSRQDQGQPTTAEAVSVGPSEGVREAVTVECRASRPLAWVHTRIVEARLMTDRMSCRPGVEEAHLATLRQDRVRMGLRSTFGGRTGST
jgi:hypothetical protein